VLQVRTSAGLGSSAQTAPKDETLGAFRVDASHLPDGATYCVSGNMGKAAGLTGDESSRSLM
jgi:hypothetical protein